MARSGGSVDIVSSSRPSDERRARLKEADSELGNGKGVPLVSNFFPIERYYDAADKLLQAFNQAYDRKELDYAYTLGKRFATFSMESLPQHNYYKLAKNARWRKQNSIDMNMVIMKLEQIALLMDDEEQKKKQLYEQRLAEQQRAIQEQRDKEARKMREIEAKIHSRRQNIQSKPEVVHSALDKLSLLEQRLAQPQQQQQQQQQKDNNETSSSVSVSTSTTSVYMTPNDAATSSHSSIGDLPPPIPPPSSSTEVSGGTLPQPIPPPQQQRPTQATRTPSNNSLPPPPSYNQIKPSPPSYNQISTLKQNGGQQQQPVPTPSSSSSPYDLKGKASTLTDEQVSSLFNLIRAESNKERNHIGAAPAGGANMITRPAVARNGHRNSSVDDRGSFLLGVGQQQQQQQQQYVSQQQQQQLLQQQQQRKKDVRPVRQLRSDLVKAYNEARNNKQIIIWGMNTYQGRYPKSTNACTVISPLMVKNHLDTPPPTGSISDKVVTDVIDRQCIPIVQAIRNKLGLDGHALIIPSDVHDYMVDEKILHQEKFVGASGGNILDMSHIGEFIKLLVWGDSDNQTNNGKNNHYYRRSGGVLFFREHVISIVKVPVGNNQFVYDLIDSLPTYGGKASRTRCQDYKKLLILLLHYALLKFSDSNLNYIDNNEWNDNTADFDPRVFQGFVWADQAT